MTVVGFTFTKINAEKKAAIKGRIDINNNISIKNVEDAPLSFDKTKGAVKFSFVYTSKFEPKIGNVELEGNLVYLQDADIAKKILAEWKKDKKVMPEVMTHIMNNILLKCNVEALFLTRDLNLPSPIPMPKIGGRTSKPGPAKK